MSNEKPPITLTNHPYARTAVEIELGFTAEAPDMQHVFNTIAKHFTITPGKPIASRAELIESGKVWQVYVECQGQQSRPLFEGCKTKAFAFIRQNFGMRAWKRGEVRLAKVIWEA